jgi:hypothetical protein
MRNVEFDWVSHAGKKPKTDQEFDGVSRAGKSVAQGHSNFQGT